ncbi:MAG: hypothetical protein ABIL02_06650 [candidate division WOR-3 bacterium]
MLLLKLEYIVVYGKHALKTLRRTNDYLPQTLRKANIYTIANSMPEERFNMHFDNRNFTVIVLFHPSYSNLHYKKQTNFEAREIKEKYKKIISLYRNLKNSKGTLTFILSLFKGEGKGEGWGFRGKAPDDVQ